MGRRAPRLLPGGPTLQPGPPFRPPRRAEPGSPRIAAAGFVCSAENLPAAPSWMHRRSGRGSGREGARGEEGRSDLAGPLPALSAPPPPSLP